MIEGILLETNSTVTTTVLQQPSGVSFFDWITRALLQTTATDWIMVAVTVALVYYARATISEGKKARKLDSYVKQLVNLFNPMAHILHRAKHYVEPLAVFNEAGESLTPTYQKLLKTDVVNLRKIFVEYGHYVVGWSSDTSYRSIESFLFYEKELDDRYLLFPQDQRSAEMCQLDEGANWADIFVAMDLTRKKLIAECKRLGGWPI